MLNSLHLRMKCWVDFLILENQTKLFDGFMPKTYNLLMQSSFRWIMIAYGGLVASHVHETEISEALKRVEKPKPARGVYLANFASLNSSVV